MTGRGRRRGGVVGGARLPALRAAALLLAQLAAPAAADYVVQVGAFTDPQHAAEAVARLRAAGYPVLQESVGVLPAGGALTRVLVGPYPGLMRAEAALRELALRGEAGFVRGYATPSAPGGLPPAAVEEAEALDSGEPAAEAATGAAGAPPAPPADAAPGLGAPLEPRAPEPQALEDLFGLAAAEERETVRVQGFFQSELAQATHSPAHLAKFRNTLELGLDGRAGRRVSWRMTGRLAYDAAFDLDDFYSDAVRDDQRTEAMLRETYLDISAGDWDFRLGRQHIVWGETVGLFFADVVSARDLREFVLPEFDYLRIPQWALRAEYFRGDLHGELIAIPYQTLDDNGVPGAEFYPYPPPPPAGYGLAIETERRPPHTLANAPFGGRLSYVTSGWDLSAFYYRSVDAAPVFRRSVVAAPAPAFVYRPDHDKIHQLGGTVSKDFVTAVMRAELIYTRDRWFNVDRLSDQDGVVRQDVFDYVVGLEFPLPARSRVNLQFFQRCYLEHDAGISQDAVESGYSVYASARPAGGSLEPKLLLIASLNRGDWLASPELIWHMADAWRLSFGADLFGGKATGLFGRYDDKDRAYATLRYIF